MSLTADKEVTRKESGFQSFPVSAGETIYKGALVCLDTDGYLIPATDTVSLKFVGIAYEKKVNTTAEGHGSDGNLWCRVYTEGIFQLVCTDITQAMVGQLVYIVDDQTVDDTSTNLIPVGRIVEYVDTASAWIDIGQRSFARSSIKLQRSTAVLKELTGQDDIAWADLDIDSLITVPVGAIGLIVEGYVYDNAAKPTLMLRKKGEDTNDWQWRRCSAQVNARALECEMIVEMDDDHIIQYQLQSTSNTKTGAFYLKLIGWIMRP